jgi:hypothetical protein
MVSGIEEIRYQRGLAYLGLGRKRKGQRRIRVGPEVQPEF